MGQSLSLSLSVALDISLPFFSDTSGGMGATLPSPSLSFNPLVHRRKRERERVSNGTPGGEGTSPLSLGRFALMVLHCGIH